MKENPVLFDVSPADGDGRKKKKARARATGRAVSDGVKEPEKSPSFIGNSATTRVIKPIGKIDDTYQCIDSRCQAYCHDILHEEAGMWFLSCAFCGCTQWLRAIPGVIQPREEQFQLRDGRFSGMTLDEVSREPHGPEFIRWAAKSHQRDAVKAACKTWLDQKNATA